MFAHFSTLLVLTLCLPLQSDKQGALLLFVAITTHKVLEAMSMSTRFLRLGCPPA